MSVPLQHSPQLVVAAPTRLSSSHSRQKRTCCSAWPCVAVCFNVLWMYDIILRHHTTPQDTHSRQKSTCCSAWLCVAVCVAVCVLQGLRHTHTRFLQSMRKAHYSAHIYQCATHCNTLQHTATHCNTLQHTATHCNTLQHTAKSALLCTHLSCSLSLTHTHTLTNQAYQWVI